MKGLIPACGHGLLSGQWGTYKSFVALELATTLMTAQPFLGGMIKRQCGVLFLAAEGADEMRCASMRQCARSAEMCRGRHSAGTRRRRSCCRKVRWRS